MYAFVCYLALWVIILKKSDRPDKTHLLLKKKSKCVLHVVFEIIQSIMHTHQSLCWILCS